jgi:tRNA threonylcarbamoyladenosine biosynthesis protein TsaE
MLSVRARSLAHTHAVAAAVASLVRSGDLIVLAGEMGAGKTAFAQGFGRALGITEPITSPTYTLVHSYPIGRLTLHHADIYRLNSLHEVGDLALPELLEANGLVLVEWGDVVESGWGDHLRVHLRLPDDSTADDDGDSARDIDIVATGRGWATRWDALVRAVTAAC